MVTEVVVLEPYSDLKLTKINLEKNDVSCFKIPGSLEDLVQKNSPKLVELLDSHKHLKKIYVSLSLSDWHKKEEITPILKDLGYETIIYAPHGIGTWLYANGICDAIVINIEYNLLEVLIINDYKLLEEYSFSGTYGIIHFLKEYTQGHPAILRVKLREKDPKIIEIIEKYYYNWLWRKISKNEKWILFCESDAIKGDFIFGGEGGKFIKNKNSYVLDKPDLANAEGLAYWLDILLENPNNADHLKIERF